MAIPNYVHPQARLFQFLADIQPGDDSLRHPVVIGPSYLLSRYGKETVPMIAFAAQSADQVLPFTYLSSGIETTLDTATHTADLDFTRLYAKNLEATLATFAYNGTPHFNVLSTVSANVIKISANRVSGGTLATALRGRAVTVGDTVYVTAASKTYKRTVLGLRGVTNAGTFGTNTDKDDTNAANGDYNPATLGASSYACTQAPTGMDVDEVLIVTNPSNFQGTVKGALYENTMGELFTLTVSTAGAPGVAEVAVTSKSGLYSGTITSTDSNGDFLFTGTADSMGGLVVKIDFDTTGNLVLGDVYKFWIKSKYTRLSTSEVALALQSGVTAYEGAADTTYVVEVTTGTYAASSGTPQVETVSVTAGAGSATGTLVVRVAGTALATDPTDVNVEVTMGDSTSVVAAAIRAALAADETITDAFIVSGATTDVILTARTAAANDATLEITLNDADSTGVTLGASANTTAGVAPDLGTSSTATGAVVRITDTAGLDSTASVTLTDGVPFELGTSGIEMTITLVGTAIPQNGLRKGDVYYVHCVAEAEDTEEFDKVVLDGPAVDTTIFTDVSVGVGVEFRLKYTGQVLSDAAADDEAWTVDATTGVTVQEGLSLYIEARDTGYEWCPYVDGVGELALYFRAIAIPGSNEDLLVIEDEEDITTQLGTIDLDNDAAFGAREMLRGTGGVVTGYALRTAGTTLADFNTALGKIEHTKRVYALAPMTTDFDVALAVASHCSTISGPTKKKFRRCYVGTDSPGAYAVLTEIDDAPVSCTVGDYGGENLLVTAASAGVDFTELELSAGDIVKFPILEVEYVIASVLSETEIILSSGPAAPISPAAQFEIWKADTAANTASYVRNRSRLLNNRRAANVWVENGKRELDGVLTIIPNRYQAAHIAGLRCALLPQQGLTRTEVSSISTAPSMYLRYTDDTLDDIAADGTWIITQDAESGGVYVRHQLTSASSEGALAYEDSVGVIVDNISFKADAIVETYIGKKNVTHATLVELRNELHDMLTAETQTDYGEDAGPALIRFEDLKIVPDTILKDRVKIQFKLVVPLPFNIGDTYITVDQDVSLAAVVA